MAGQAMAITTLGTHWRDHALAGLWCVAQLGRPDAAPAGEPAPETLGPLLDRLAAAGAGSPAPAASASPAEPSGLALLPAPPPLVPGARYTVVALNGLTVRGRHSSAR